MRCERHMTLERGGSFAAEPTHFVKTVLHTLTIEHIKMGSTALFDTSCSINESSTKQFKPKTEYTEIIHRVGSN